MLKTNFCAIKRICCIAIFSWFLDSLLNISPRISNWLYLCELFERNSANYKLIPYGININSKLWKKSKIHKTWYTNTCINERTHTKFIYNCKIYIYIYNINIYEITLYLWHFRNFCVRKTFMYINCIYRKCLYIKYETKYVYSFCIVIFVWLFSAKYLSSNIHLCMQYYVSYYISCKLFDIIFIFFMWFMLPDKTQRYLHKYIFVNYTPLFTYINYFTTKINIVVYYTFYVHYNISYNKNIIYLIT